MQEFNFNLSIFTRSQEVYSVYIYVHLRRKISRCQFKNVQGGSVKYKVARARLLPNPFCVLSRLMKKQKEEKKNSHIEMWLKCSSKSYCTRPVFSGPHSSCQLASKWFFFPCSRSSSCSPSLPFKTNTYFFPFYQIMTLLVIAAGLLDSYNQLMTQPAFSK